MAQAVTNIEEGKSLVQFGKALVTFDIREQVIMDLEEAAKLEITDTASEKVVRKHRQNAKSLEVQIEKRRLELNREFKEKTDTAAGLITPRITAAYNTLDEKVKVVEAEREARKVEKELAEKLRLGKIQWHMDGLWTDCEAGLEYNLPADEIKQCLDVLLNTEISAVDYQEFTIEAKEVLKLRIDATQTALENRKKFEADQAEAALVKVEQEKERKRLEEERAKLESDRKAQEEANRKAAEAEAEIRRQEEDEIRAEREALEAEKERIQTVQNAFNIIPSTIRDKADNPEYLNEYFHYLSVLNVDETVFQDRADEFNAFIEAQKQAIIELAHSHAIKDHKQWKIDLKAEIDQARSAALEDWKRSEKYKAEAAAREKLIDQDKLIMKFTVECFDDWISNYFTPHFETQEAMSAYHDLITSIKAAIDCFERVGIALA